MPRVPERIRFAIAELQARDGERVAEIGCGTGQAIALALQSPGIFLYGIDRSAHAIAKASKLNEMHISSGRLCLERRDLSDASPEQFDRVFAINVNIFWLKPGLAFSHLDGWLDPGAPLLLVFEAPTASRLSMIVETLSAPGATAPFVPIRRRSRADIALVAMEFMKDR